MDLAREVRNMTDMSETPKQANDVAHPSLGLGLVPNILNHAPALTKNWGAFRAFVGVMTALMVLGIIIRPEAALPFGGIYLTAILVALFAAYKKLLD
jgi:hypothetical protein